MDAYGHVNNAVYLNYLEEARDRALEELFGTESYDFVLAHVDIDYRREITQDDGEVTVESRVIGWGRLERPHGRGHPVQRRHPLRGGRCSRRGPGHRDRRQPPVDRRGARPPHRPLAPRNGVIRPA